MKHRTDSRKRASAARPPHRRPAHPSGSREEAGFEPPAFTPVAVKPRHDGWTAARQIAFIQTLADTACVEEACERVGKSPRSAYALRRRPGAESFREAWDIALDYAVTRVDEAALGRALKGVAQPIFYKGEKIGERRHFDERLTMFILRYRMPERYGAWLDQMVAKRGHPDGSSWLLTEAIGRLAKDAEADRAGRPRERRAPLRRIRHMDDPAEIERQQAEAERSDAERSEREFQAYLETMQVETQATGGSDFRGDVA